MTREYLPTSERRGVVTSAVPAFRPKPMFRFRCCEAGCYSVPIRPKPRKAGTVSFNTEDIPERVDTGVGGSNNAQTLSAALTHRWTCVGAKCNKGDLCGIVCIIVT